MAEQHRVNLTDIYNRIGGVEEKLDTMAQAVQEIREDQDDLNDRLSEVEGRMPGHSDAEIVQMIDDRMHAIMPAMIRQAVHDELVEPLHRVDESIRASQRNRDAIRQVQADLQPLVEIRDGIVFIRRAVVSISSVVTAVAVIWAVFS